MDDIRFRKIIIKAKRKIFSEMAGNNLSHFEGEGFDFVELREYHFGDDVRKIDWKVTAKKQKPYIKIFREEKELNVVIVSLMGGSVYFGSKRFKQDMIAELFALLSFSAVKNQDNFSSVIFTDKAELYTKPTKKMYGAYKGVEEILKFDPLGKEVDYKKLVSYLRNRIKRRSIIFLVGDFIGDIDISHLSKKHEVVSLVVRDRLEENPPAIGYANLLDPNNKKFVQMDLDEGSLKNYKKMILQNDAKLFKHFIKNRVRFTKIYTDDDPFVKLSKLLR